MKKLRLLLIVMLMAELTSAQTFEEWFRQKKTQVKYLTEQIAALKVYATYVEKGYDIAKKGLNLVQDIQKGDFKLHRDYFSSLQKVNPDIKACSKIADIIALQIQIVQNCHQAKNAMMQSGSFTAGEIGYSGKVFENILEGCSEIIDRLMAVTTDGQSEMTDDERMKTIDRLYNDMQGRYLFTRHFENENKMLALQRMKERNDVRVSGQLFGMK